VTIPDRGDLVWIDFEPQVGREIQKTRPAIILSPAVYNGKSHLVILCPITSRSKGFPFEVALPSGLPVEGVVMSDQVKSMDWEFRRGRVVGRVPPEVLEDVLSKLATLIGG
jgi:mRNA interferase MazF